MAQEQLSPGEILSLSGAYWKSCALHAAVALDVFSPLVDGGKTAQSLAGSLGCDARALAMLLNAMTALGFLEKHGDKYRLNETSSTFLVPSSPRSVCHAIRHHRNLVDSWGKLDVAVKTGSPVRLGSQRRESDREDFFLGMFNLAMGVAPKLAPQLDLAGRKHLLDLGGGPGTYAVQLCLAHPQLKATVFDLPTSRPFAEKIMARFKVQERVAFQAGDYHVDDIVGTYDAAWLSHILHAEGPEGCRAILAKAVAVLEPGGILYVHEFVLNNDLDGPVFPVLFSLNMLLGTKSGQAYSDGQIRVMLAEAGLTDIKRLPFMGPNDSGVIAGIKT